MSRKQFYVVLALVAVVGVAALWTARVRSGDGGGATSVSSEALASVGEYQGYVMGNNSAPVEVVEFADFQCPACARFAILTGSDVKARLVDRGLVRWRFHDFPLPIHSNAPAAHLAAACAGEQGQFWAMHDHLFYNQGRWSRDSRPDRHFREYAQAIGVDLRRYNDCVDSGRYRARIEAGKNEAITLGVTSTPSFLIGDVLVAGSLPFDSIESLVKKQASRAQP